MFACKRVIGASVSSGTGPAKARFFNVFVALAQPSPLVRASLPSFCWAATP